MVYSTFGDVSDEVMQCNVKGKSLLLQHVLKQGTHELHHALNETQSHKTSAFQSARTSDLSVSHPLILLRDVVVPFLICRGPFCFNH